MSEGREGAVAAGSNVPRADANRIAADIDALRGLTLPDRPYTRRAFTPIYGQGRQWLSAAMADAGLRPETDAGGNLVGRSRETDRGSVAIGSHIDTVPDGGAYDGVAGVVAGLEVARLIKQRSIDLPFAFEVIDFLSEEPSDFGVSCIGSRATAGTLSEQDLARTDGAGTSLREALRAVGGRPEALGAPLRERGSLRAYLELHIEQGPVLERTGAPVAIVTEIVGIRRYEVRLAGNPSHAGTTPMDSRHDALPGAAELVLAVERLARDRAGEDGFVGTVGQLAVTPNAANVVPGEVTATVELRAPGDESLDAVQRELEARIGEVASERGLALRFSEASRTPPVELDHDLRAMLAQAADAAGVQALQMVSGGGHDAGHVAAIAPAAMVFVPCREGLSHAPGESADPDDIAVGAQLMLQVVRELAARR
jgi:beta-ureidopropionase / N-carbamoyl-L-amino-acid hydrolase